MHRLLDTTLLSLYFVPASILMLFGLNLYFMLFLFLRRLRGARQGVEAVGAEFRSRFTAADLPHVVTQLPLYNERNVAERVMRAAAAMDYPAGRHTVQVLDDSTDETAALVDGVAAELRAAGHDVQVVRRPNREGFKAGALRYGMAQIPADFFAIFDADFVPPRDFLLRTIEVLMVRPEVGFVQGRWGHLNAKQSAVTRAQAIGIDAHFAIEQPARAWNGLFMNFNGTAGLWRRRAIEEAGGWEHDTLTEDMDLSYRSQMAGWKPFFLFDLVVPAELPDNINAFKVQQFRWAKGSIQTAIKLLPRVFRSGASWLAKIEAAFHMTHYIIYPLMVLVAFLALPALQYTSIRYSTAALVALFTLLVLSTVAPISMYIISQAVLYRSGWSRLRFLPFLSSIGVGIAIANSRAVIEAIAGIKSAFIRTPKKGVGRTRIYSVRLSLETVFELLLGVYCFATFLLFLHAHKYLMVPFLFLYAWGFTGVGLLSVLHFLQENRWVRTVES
jgi:cellulose synthase/poly-beta-1,6-N-acetylglucosamine synthase-like glycosyltransferase